MHIPFCRSKCPYCDFFSVLNREKADAYVASLNEHIRAAAQKYECKVDTIYIGGGTPSALSAKSLVSVIGNIKESFECELCEVTAECNPSDASPEFFEELACGGVNRVSFGMQSAVESERRALGRRANSAQVKTAVEEARKGGIHNISLDIMLGIPAQNEETLKKSIDFCAECGVQHISAYMLKIENGTPFARNIKKLRLPSDDETADLYLSAVEKLGEYGFKQYEISNFAKESFESLHNLKYWRLEDYIGIGAAAHSFIGSERFFYPRDIDYFIAGGAEISEGKGGGRDEKIMLGLRLKEGIKESLLSDKAKKALPFLSQNGFLNIGGGRLELTTKGFLVSNSIINMLTE